MGDDHAGLSEVLVDAGLREAVVATGLAHGLDAVGVCSAHPFESTRVHLETRRARKLHAGMAFTYRNPERSTTPTRVLDNARSIVVGARSYAREPAPPDHAGVPDPAGQARVAAYAWHDHYADLRHGLDAVAERLRADGWRAVVVADENALVDRAVAHRAGLGWYGKNTTLLMPGRGSRVVLGSVVTDAPLPVDDEAIADRCGPCRRCLDACPTDAFAAPGVLDARRCLAWLVQQAGTFPVEYRAALGDRLYGCDDCQDVCPVNRPSNERRSAAEPDAEPFVPVAELLEASDSTLLERFGRWYIPNRDPAYLRRNALIVLGNVGDGRHPRVAELLERALADTRTVVRAHAVWAARRLGRDDLLASVLDDRDPGVRAELDRDPGVRAELDRDPGVRAELDRDPGVRAELDRP